MTNSTPVSARSTQTDRAERIARAVAEVEASRAHITELEARIELFGRQLAEERSRAALQTERADLLDARIALLDSQVALLREALALAEQNAELLRADLARVRRERDSAQRRVWIAGAVGITLGVVIAAAASGH